MTKPKIKSTCEEFVESLSTKEKKIFHQEYRELLLSELLLATMQQDKISIRRLAKLAGVSPTLVQSMRSETKKDFTLQSFFKVLRGLGCKKVMVELHGKQIPLNIATKSK